MILSNCIAPPFFPVHIAIRDEVKTSFWLKGGRGSTKSSFVAMEIVLGIVKFPDANALCIRKVAETLRDSCLATMEWAIDTLQLSMFFRVTRSPATITYAPTGQQILMKGLDNPLKLKSVKAKKGYFKYLWFEEAAELDSPEELRSVQQSVLRGGEKFIEFITYNPPREPTAWINEEYRKRMLRPDHYTHHSTYKDVPEKWLGPKFLKDAHELEKENPVSYAHEYLGEEVGRSDAMIFAGCTRTAAFEAVRDIAGQYHVDGRPVAGPYYGADFGFAKDPGVLVRCFIDDGPDRRRRLYVEYEDCHYDTLLDDLPAAYERVPESRKYRVWGDSSRPETIAHLRARQFDIASVEKWPGSVEDGITVLQSFDIIIHVRCINLIKEARLYCYKIDRLTRQVLPDIVDKYNHGWDAVRYALNLIIKRKPKGFFS